MYKGVAGGSLQLAADQGIIQAVLVDHRSAGRIDKDRAGLEVIEHRSGDHMLRTLDQRHIDVHHVGAFQKLFQGFHLFKAAPCGLVCRNEGIISQNLYTKSGAHDMGDPLGDIAHADLAKGLALDLCSQKVTGGDGFELAPAAFGICLHDAPLHCQEQSHRHFCNRIRVSRGGIDHLDSPLFGCLYVDGVDTDPVLGNDLQLLRFVHHFRRDRDIPQDDGIDLLDVVKIVHHSGVFPQLFRCLRIDVFAQIDDHKMYPLPFELSPSLRPNRKCLFLVTGICCVHCINHITQLTLLSIDILK